MDNDEWMPDKETRMKGFNYFARGYADRSLDADIKNFRLNESTRSEFSPYVEYTKLGGEVESRNVEHRMNMTPEERIASLAAETEDVSREDQIFLMSGDGGNANSEMPQERETDDDYSEFAKEHGVDADMVKDYASGMKTGNLQKADIALAEIRRTMRVANRGMKLSEFGKLFRPVQKELTECYGDIEKLRQEHIDAVIRERGVMEAARKRAEEEKAKRKARADELSLLSTEELDKRYFDAVERGDDAAAREMLDEAARRKGYDDTESNYQGVGAWIAPSDPGYESDAERRADVEDNAPDVNIEDIALGYSLVDENYWHEPRKYMQTDATAIESVNAIREAIAAVRRGEKNVKVKVYRAVPTSVKEGKLRNGDWVTPSKGYAEMHGNNRLEGKYRIIEDEVPVSELWWDGNDSREWGFDDGRGYKYKNVENNRKLNDLVTRDDNGEIIPPSKRFDENVEDVRFREGVSPKAQMKQRVKKWLSPENLQMASGKTRDEIFEQFGNELEPIAIVPKGYLRYLGDGFENNALYCGKGYMVDHAANHHAEEPIESYEQIQDILDYPDVVRLDNRKDRPSLIFVKKYDNYKSETISVDVENGKLVIHKTLNHRKKEPHKALPSVAIESPSEDEITSISHSSNEESASSDFSALDGHDKGTDYSNTAQLSDSEKAKHQAATDLAQKLHVEGDVEVVTTTKGLTGRQAKAKGWYDVKTGRITIVLPNHNGRADVVNTILHEAVGHYGLRELVGKEKMNEFLDFVFKNADKATRSQIAHNSAKYGWDMRKATEEYMASMAEDGTFKNVNKRWWHQLKLAFLKMLHKLGFAGFSGTTLSDNDLRYLLWRSWKNLTEGPARNIYQVAEDTWRQQHLKVGDFAEPKAVDAKTREQNLYYREERERKSARDEYERSVNTAKHKMNLAWVDSMSGLKLLQDAIVPNEKDLKDWENAYMAENRMSSTNLAEMETYKKSFYKDLLDAEQELLDKGAIHEQVTNYMMAKHGLERNEVLELFGKGVKFSDLFSIERKLENGVVSFYDGGDKTQHEIPQGNLLYIYMVNKMPDGKMKLRKMGISEGDVETIADFIDPRLKQFADWVQSDFLVKKRDKYNAVHERLFGASMADIENYFPLNILKDAITRNVEIEDMGREVNRVSTIPGGFKKRVRNSLPLDIMEADAFSVLMNHIKEMEHLAAFADWNKDLNTLLSYKRFRIQVKNMASVYGSGQKLLNHFEKVCQIAAGVYKPETSVNDKFAMNIAKGVTGAKVSGRMFTAFKQLTSFPAYLSDANPIYLAEGLSRPYKAWKWSMENLPILRERWQGRFAGDPLLMSNENDWKLWRTRTAELAAKYGMAPNAFVDALTISMGTYAIYKTKLAKYLRMGYDESTAEERAKQDATIAYNQTQQSSEGAFMSVLQSDRTYKTAMLTAFRNSSMSYTRQLYDALRNYKRLFTPGYKGMTEEFMAKQMERDGLDPQNASKYAKREYRKAWINNFVKVGVFGFLLQYVWNLVGYAPYLAFGDDKDKKKKMWSDILTHSLFGSVEGLSLGDVWSALGNTLFRENKYDDKFNANNFRKELPIATDLNNMLKDYESGGALVALNDVINLVVQSGIGFNPQTLTDALVAVYDYCGADDKTARECALMIMRVMNCPPSQMKQIYFDEIDATGEQASKMTPAQIAERYARYKLRKDAPFTSSMYSDDTKNDKLSKYKKQVTDEAKTRFEEKAQTEETKRLYEEYDKTAKKVSKIRQLQDTDTEAYQKQMREMVGTAEFKRYRRIGLFKSLTNKLAKQMLRSKSASERKKLHEQLIEQRDKMLNDVKGIE